MKKVLVVHNILWAHYKSVLFEALYNLSIDKYNFQVLQIAKNEVSRKNMQFDSKQYQYPNTLLFDDCIENVSWYKKTWYLLREIYKQRPDIINFTGYATDISIVFGIFFAKILNLKIIISNESTTIDQPSSFLKTYLKKIILYTADYFICFGSSSAQYLIDMGMDQKKIIEQKAAVVDSDKILWSHKNLPKFETKFKSNFLFVGRFIDIKNIDLLINAFNVFCETNQNWGLILVGHGPKMNDFHKVSLQNTAILIFEPVAWDQVPRFFSEHNVLVLPSKSEPWGLVVNEAMICGMPVIVSDFCGCADDLVKNNGFVFESDNEQQLLTAMLKMAESESKRMEMGNTSRMIIEKFNPKLVAERLTQAFLKIN